MKINSLLTHTSCLKKTKKAFRVMKIAFLLMFIFVTQLFALNSKAQNAVIELQSNNLPIEELFKTIEAQTDYLIVYSTSEIRSNFNVSLSKKKAQVSEILDEVLSNRGLKYEFSDNYIILSKSDKQQSNKRKISGTVTDSQGEVIIGANIVEKGTNNGTITDMDGHFQLDVANNAILVTSYIGYVSQEIKVNRKNIISIILGENSEALEEVVVVGYGTQKKVNLTGAVEQVTTKELANKSVANLGQALQGLIPNLNISIPNGNPISAASYNIRGATSFSGSDFVSGSPLIMVDGIPMDINNLNPDDIESISVIKDASAAAIYGARAAYGVILVSTKKGKRELAPKISYSGSYTIQSPTGDPGLLSSLDYQEAIMNAMVLEGGSPSKDDDYKLEQVKNYYNNPTRSLPYYMNGNNIVWVGNVNPWKELIKKNAPMHNHVLSISGGGNRSSYYASLGYRDQDGIIRVNQDWKKTYNATLGITSDITKWLTVDAKVLYTQYKSQIPHGQGYTESNVFEFLAMQGWRNLLTPRYTPEDSPVGVKETHIALNGLSGNINNKTENLMFKIGASVKLIDNLVFKTDFAYKSTRSNEKTTLPLIPRISTSWVPVTEGYSTLKKSSTSNDYFVYNAYADYSKVFKEKHDISVVAGFNQELYKSDDLWAQGLDMITDNVPVLKLTTGTKTLGDNESHWAIRGAFFRLNYIFDNKYLFEMNGRYDGTSKFPKDRRFKFFPSFSIGWRLSEEKFMENLRSKLSNLKLRASFGSLGNQDVNNYAYISTYGLVPQVAYIMNGSSPIGITPPGLVSPDLTWETATTFDVGLDITLIDKLTVNYDWYKRKTKDILTSAEKLPSVLGANIPNKNSGEMETTGWELSAKWNDRLENGLTYGVTFMLSDYQSKVISFSGNPSKLISSLYEGKKMGEIWGYVTEGLFQSYEEIEKAPTQIKIDGGVWRPGDVKFKDLNGDNEIDYGATTVDNPGDKKIIGNSTPRFQFGLNVDLAWKGFDFNMFWQGTGKRDYWTNSYLYWGLIRGSNINGGSGTKWTYNNSWTPNRTDAYFPAFKPAEKNMSIQSRYLLNAAYAKLKNVTIGYTIPQIIMSKIGIERLRIYASGYNLLTISKVPDILDPEMLNDAYPTLHSFTFGAQITF